MVELYVMMMLIYHGSPKNERVSRVDSWWYPSQLTLYNESLSRSRQRDREAIVLSTGCIYKNKNIIIYSSNIEAIDSQFFSNQKKL